MSRIKKSHEEIDELLNVNKPPPTPEDTRENTEEIEIIGTQSTIDQDTHTKLDCDPDGKNNTKPTETILPDIKPKIETVGGESVSKQVNMATPTEEQPKQAENNTPNNDENGKIPETIKDSLSEQMSELLKNNVETGNGVDSKDDITQNQTPPAEDINKEKSSDPKPVTDIKCDVKIFITEDGDNAKTYEHK